MAELFKILDKFSGLCQNSFLFTQRSAKCRRHIKETPVLVGVPFLIKLQSGGLQISLERDSSTDVFL